MGLTEKIIHPLTLSQNRIRRFKESGIYQVIFDNIVRQLIGVMGYRRPTKKGYFAKQEYVYNTGSDTYTFPKKHKQWKLPSISL